MSGRHPVFVINLKRHAARKAHGKTFAPAFHASLAPQEIGCFESHRKVWNRILEMEFPGAACWRTT